MKKEDAEEYTAIREQHFHSSYRDILLGIKLGVPKALGLSTEAWIKRIGGRVQLPPPERKKAVKELKSEGFSNRKIGEVLGVSYETVARDSIATNVAFSPIKTIENATFVAPLQTLKEPSTPPAPATPIRTDLLIKKPDYGQDDEDSLIKAKQAARYAKEILAKIEKKGTSFLSLRENALAASNEWAKVANAAVQPSTTLRSVE